MAEDESEMSATGVLTGFFSSLDSERWRTNSSAKPRANRLIAINMATRLLVFERESMSVSLPVVKVM